MQTLHQWIWQEPEWPRMRWDQGVLAPLLARARLAQGKALGATRLLDAGLTLEAAAAILVEDGITTSAIEGERLDLDAVRSSVARHLGLPTAGLPAPPRAVDGLIDVLLDATGGYDKPLTTRRLFGWHAALFPYGRSGLHTIRSGALRRSMKAGDAAVEVILRDAARTIGWAMAGVVNMLAPDTVVLGGGLVEEMPGLFSKEVAAGLHEQVMPAFAGSYDVKVAQLGDDAGVQGAAAWAEAVVSA